MSPSLTTKEVVVFSQTLEGEENRDNIVETLFLQHCSATAPSSAFTKQQLGMLQ